MAFFNRKNKKEKKEEDSKQFDQLESDLIVHNMPSYDRLNKEITNKELVGDISLKGDNLKAQKESKLIGILIISVGLIVILLIAFLTYKYVISPTAKDNDEKNKITIPIKDKDIEKEAEEDVEEMSDEAEDISADGSSFVTEAEVVSEDEKDDADDLDSLMQEEFPGIDSEELPPLIDTDGDGLYDVEEIILQTSIHKKDTDDDGHDDLIEIRNLYNPIGDGDLSEAHSIETYTNSNPDFSFLYPKEWKVDKINDKFYSIELKDGTFINLSIQDNIEKISILSWYQDTFSDLNISNGRLLASDFYDGVISEDSLIVYLTDKLKEQIFVFSYIPASPDRLSYINIFEIIYSSLAK